MVADHNIQWIEDPVERFFAFARERHTIYVRRQKGQSWPWTTDSILQTYKFTNVFRELDKTTDWFRRNVREPMRDDPDVLLATVVFRWFNRITTGEAIFQQRDLSGGTAWDVLRQASVSAGVENLLAAVRSYCGRGPYVTGSYMIKTPSDMDKAAGVCDNITKFMARSSEFKNRDTGALQQMSWYEVADHCMSSRTVRLEDVWRWLCVFPYQGPFLAYEVVTDLRHTKLLDWAPDSSTWACAGPGAKRGLNRLRGRPVRQGLSQTVAVQEMRKLLQLSRVDHRWPRSWPEWEMREVEHILCEFDKYERARLGEGTPKALYRGDNKR